MRKRQRKKNRKKLEKTFTITSMVFEGETYEVLAGVYDWPGGFVSPLNHTLTYKERNKNDN